MQKILINIQQGKQETRANGKAIELSNTQQHCRAAKDHTNQYTPFKYKKLGYLPGPRKTFIMRFKLATTFAQERFK